MYSRPPKLQAQGETTHHLFPEKGSYFCFLNSVSSNPSFLLASWFRPRLVPQHSSPNHPSGSQFEVRQPIG